MPWLIPVAAGVAGAVGGAAGSKQTSSVNVGDPSAIESQAGSNIGSDYNTLRGYADMGPNGSDITAGVGASRDLAAMLQSYMQPGGANPTAGDISSGNSLAEALFGRQQQQLNQSFTQQGVDAARLSASMGREANDPILQAKLRTGFMNQQALLNADQGAFATNYSMNQPMQRLGFANQRASLLGGLASQAMSNRASILGLGGQIQGNERNWRLSTADRTNSSGGGLAGALSGAIGGFGAGMGIGQKAGMFSGAAAPMQSGTVPDFGSAYSGSMVSPNGSGYGQMPAMNYGGWQA